MATCYASSTGCYRPEADVNILRQELVDELHIIFTLEQVLVSKKLYASWQEIQAEFYDYKASLGPWDAAETVSWLTEEYDLVPSAEEQVELLLSSDQTVRTLSFAPD